LKATAYYRVSSNEQDKKTVWPDTLHLWLMRLAPKPTEHGLRTGMERRRDDSSPHPIDEREASSAEVRKTGRVDAEKSLAPVTEPAFSERYALEFFAFQGPRSIQGALVSR
jgi:hypothetical protein